MNLGILIFTLARLITPSSALSLFFMTVVMPCIIGMTPKTGKTDVADMFVSSLFNTIMPLLIGYIIVADNVANSKNLNDGEYLSLLFTRPITRSSYVLSKWVAGTIGVALCVFVAYTFLLIGYLISGRPAAPDPVECANILLNCFSAVALVVLVSTVPLRLGVFLLVVVFYVSGLGPLFTTVSMKATTNGQVGVAAFASALGSVLLFLQSLTHQSIDLNEIMNSVSFSWKTVIVYFSNLTVYLSLAILIMNKREFYYASE